jgi:hypothetical protein
VVGCTTGSREAPGEMMIINEIRIAKAISSNIKMEFWMRKCARVSLKSGKVHRKQHRKNRTKSQ